MEIVTGICCPGTLFLPEYQTVGTEQVVALVPADGHHVTKMLTAHDIQLAHTGTGHEVGTDMLAVKHYARAKDVKV